MASVDELAAQLDDDVLAALDEVDPAARQRRLREAARDAFLIAYADTPSDDRPVAPDADAFVGTLQGMFNLTHPDVDNDDQPALIARLIAHAAVNAAVVAANPGVRKTWVTMLDDRVRDTHRPLHGATVAAAETFDVGGYPLSYPGQPIGPPEIWINCRCVLRMAATVTAAAANGNSGVVVVARPTDPDQLVVPKGLPADELHVTLGYYGDADAAPEGLREALSDWVGRQSLATEATVGGVARMGFDDPPATTLLLESPELAELRLALEQVAPPDTTHPHFTPHLTLGYGLDLPETMPETVPLDAVELWWGDQRGGAMDPTDTIGDALGAAISEEPWSNFSASDYTIEQWRRACLITMPGGDPEAKSTYKLPVRTPSGAVSRAGVHAAAAALAGARGGVDAPASEKAKAARALRGLYRQLGDTPPDSLKADATDPDVLEGWAPSTSPPGTHDAPGWVTNPRETQRLRDYWTRGAGAGKIRWGQPGDFDRCRSQLRKYVPNPSYLAGTCANLHFVALGYWPNQGPHASRNRGRRGLPGDANQLVDTEEIIAVTAAFETAAAEAAQLPPLDWFQDPGLDGPTPLTVTEDGRVLGHLATFDTCHVGISGACTQPPRSHHDYAYFRTGEAETAGGMVSVGQITMDTGHAGTDLGPTAAVSHYDDTGTVVADVAAGEDDYGIWVAGALRPGLSDAQLRGLRAGALSGDWRRIGGNLELVAALVVNVPGFPIPRTQVASAGGQDFALVAAAVVTLDPNAVDADRVAIAVMAALDQRQAARERAVRAAALANEINELRVGQLLAAVES